MLFNAALAASLATALLLADASSSSEAPPASDDVVVAALTAPAGEPAVQPATAPAKPAGVTGRVILKGDAPAGELLDMSSDPFCVGENPDGFERHSVLVGSGGGLKDVFVSITNAPDERYKAPKEAVVLDQRGCNYTPHVFGVVKKQDIEILNSDDTLHNIHAVPKRNKEFNIGMPMVGMKVKKDFKKAEDAILIKCDVHPWMKAFYLQEPVFGLKMLAAIHPRPALPT